MSRKTAFHVALIAAVAILFTAGTSLEAQTAASVTSVGKGFSSEPSAPQFITSQPLIGASVSMLGSHCPADHVAYVFVGLSAKQPAQLPKGGFLYLNPDLMLFSGPLAISGAGTFLSAVALPADPGLEGVKIALQVLTLSTVDPTDYAVSNGVEWICGY